MEVVRKHLHWRPTLDAMYGADQGFPVFFVEEPGEEGSDQTTDGNGNQPTDGPLVGGNTRFFYGFPKLDMRGLKVAEHSDGALVEDPLTCERGPEREDTLRVEDFIRRRLAGVAPDGGEHASCFYTMTPDGHFIVDQLPNAGHVAFAAGLSGHGFKFASVLGETLSQLALGESPTCDIDFLRASRFMES